MDEGSGVHGQDRPLGTRDRISQEAPAIGADYQEALRRNLANAIVTKGSDRFRPAGAVGRKDFSPSWIGDVYCAAATSTHDVRPHSPKEHQ